MDLRPKLGIFAQKQNNFHKLRWSGIVENKVPRDNIRNYLTYELSTKINEFIFWSIGLCYFCKENACLNRTELKKWGYKNCFTNFIMFLGNKNRHDRRSVVITRVLIILFKLLLLWVFWVGWKWINGGKTWRIVEKVLIKKIFYILFWYKLNE